MANLNSTILQAAGHQASQQPTNSTTRSVSRHNNKIATDIFMGNYKEYITNMDQMAQINNVMKNPRRTQLLPYTTNVFTQN